MHLILTGSNPAENGCVWACVCPQRLTRRPLLCGCRGGENTLMAGNNQRHMINLLYLYCTKEKI